MRRGVVEDRDGTDAQEKVGEPPEKLDGEWGERGLPMARSGDARENLDAAPRGRAAGMGLTELEGIGETTASRIRDEFGSEEAFRQAAMDLEVHRIAGIEGLSGRRAVDVVLQIQGREPHDFLRTDRARTLYEDVLDRLLSRAHTTRARDRIRTLVPLRDEGEMGERIEEALAARDAVRDLPRDEVEALLRRLGGFREPDRAYHDDATAILVDDRGDYERLVEEGVDRHCTVLTPEDTAYHDGYDLVVYAYSQGKLDLEGAENVVSVPFTSDPARLVPEATIHRFEANQDLLEALEELHGLLGEASPVEESTAGACLDRMGKLAGADRDWDEVVARLEEAVEGMNDAFREAVQDLSIEGDEVLSMMGGDQPRKVASLQNEILTETREELMDELGEDFGGVFAGDFPLELDREALERKRQQIVGRWRRQGHRRKAEAAQDLSALEDALQEEIQAFLDFDYRYAVGTFVADHDLHAPAFGEGLEVREALHLDLVEEGGQRVDYHVGAGDGEPNVVLLTGANSGGKTTLLETLAQVTILAHMGLPVNAREATVEPVDALHFFTRKRSLDAGALESFLKDFVPILTSGERKLVLADELEAMTEVEAAARIVGTFVDMLAETDSLGVFVTHMAEEVSAFADVRVDGIEAAGLDEDLELVVDRTPRIGYTARSTPELILERLAKTGEAGQEEVFERVLEAFEDRAGGDEGAPGSREG